MSEIALKLNRPQTSIVKSNADRNLYHSGQGGGKTFVMGFISYRLAELCPKTIGLIAANTYGQLTDATLIEIFKVWSTLGWDEYSENKPNGYYVIDKKPPSHFQPHGYVFKNNNNKIFLKNGAVIFTASLDNYKAIDGRTIGWAMLDETKDTKEDAVKKVIIGRLRMKGICRVKKYIRQNVISFIDDNDKNAGEQANPLFVFTSPAKEQWLTEFFKLESYREEILTSIFSETDYFYKRDQNRCVVIASTYHNKANLPPNYISNMKGDLSEDIIEMNIYGSPFGKTGSEYYATFKKSEQVRTAKYNPDLPIHMAWDFNVNPYMSANLWQIEDSGQRMKIWAFKEYALAAPRNSIEDICSQFKIDFPNHQAGLFVYGDASGNNQTVIKSVRDFYQLIQFQLKEYWHGNSKCLLRANPRHKTMNKGMLGRRDFMNKCLAGGFGFEILIDPSCKHLIADFEFLKEDSNGAKDKKKELINGIRCEKYGHQSDAADGFFCYRFGRYAKRGMEERSSGIRRTN